MMIPNDFHSHWCLSEPRPLSWCQTNPFFSSGQEPPPKGDLFFDPPNDSWCISRVAWSCNTTRHLYETDIHLMSMCQEKSRTIIYIYIICVCIINIQIYVYLTLSTSLSPSLLYMCTYKQMYLILYLYIYINVSTFQKTYLWTSHQNSREMLCICKA